MKRKLLAIASLVLALPFTNAMASDYKGTIESSGTWWSPSRLYIGAYQGYGEVDGMLHNDGQSAIGRLVFGLDAYSYQWGDWTANFGGELGLQSGKTMRHAPAENDPDAEVDIPIQTTLNPVLDLLFVLKLHCMPYSPFYGILKGGVAYRQLRFLDGDFVSSSNQGSGEFQAGIGYELTPNARIVAYYQGIYANGKVQYIQRPDTTVYVTNIPTQQAGFLGLEFAL